ncbi:uncharacterized protein LOC128741135 [Sabethes cyaneus]|uniref:uncharacterized protein LOC128741135 n=1 Tax=Sabethes cyaneus TaxID=53552 RepID=UPI00237DD0C9|nr:uncharacterized protein LOC128741135 [Sabethes cyaneus]
MPRVNFTRTDRIAQMSQQEQLIAQKRQQILEKQRTLQMAKQIVAEASKNNASVDESETDKSSAALKIPFNNDGSFLENFKKLSEKFAKTNEDQNKRVAEEEPSNSEKKFKADETVQIPILPPPPPPAPPVPPSIAAVPAEIAYASYYNIAHPPPMMALLQPAPLPPPIPEAVIEPIRPDVAPEVSVEVCPQQPQLQTQQPSLEPVPEVGAECKVFSENDKLPTTVEELVELVADIGDVYEEKLSSRKNDLHPSLWFLFDRQSEAYRNYRHMIVARLFKTAGIEHALPPPPQPFRSAGPSAVPTVPRDDSKYDPEDVLDDTNMDEEVQTLAPEDQAANDEPIQMQPNYYGDEKHFYDDKSTTETDSDTEFVREARKRNLKNLKRKTMNAGNVREDTSTDTDDDFGESSEGKQDSHSEKAGNSSGGGGGAKNARQKHRKKSRWGDQMEGADGQDFARDSKGSADNSQNSTTANSELPSSSYGGVQPQQHQNSRLNPGLLQFVFQCFGTVDVSPESWKKAEEHFRIRLLYEDMSSKIQLHERFASNQLMGNGGNEQIDTEQDHILNADKMNAVLLWINEITKFYDRTGATSLESFLMRDEYDSFMCKFRKHSDSQPNFEDYKKLKLEQAKIVSTNSRGEYSSTDSDFVKNKPLETLEEPTQAGATVNESETNAKRRKSRWGDQVSIQATPSSAPDCTTPSQTSGPSSSHYQPAKLSTVGRSDPALLAYVRQNFGTTNLSEEDWRKAEDHYKINLLYQDMLRKRQEIDRLAASGKFKYEYDSDEDTTGGTWEHKLRSQEMEATQLWANELTKKSEGKHHIGDFLPPEELRKFMEKYDAQKNNRQPNLSDYKEYKLKEDNVGFQMLQKLGWKEGQGLGADGSGIVDPINKASQRDNNQGLGVMPTDNPEVDDNEYDAYRKRMMLAYRFRPNPLNNPRRAYY